MIRPFLFALCAAAVLADPAAVEQPAGKLPVRAPSTGGRQRQGGVSAKALFGLVGRTGCDGTSSTGPTCPQGRGCCYSEEVCCGTNMCILDDETCCDNGNYSCVGGESCCGSGCMPSDAVCCGDGTYSIEGKGGCSANNPFSIFSPGPTFTDRYGLTSSTAGSSSFASLPTFSDFSVGASTPTFVAGGGGTGNSVAGGCDGAQKVISGGAAYKGGHGGGGSSGGSSGSSSSGDDTGDSSSSGSSVGGTSAGGGPAGCASSASMITLSLSTLAGAFVGTLLLL